MNIEQQKQVADKVYSMLMLVDPHCILAGGAPRDWYFGTECNDLDFYFCTVAGTIDDTEDQLVGVGFKGIVPTTKPRRTSELYGSMDGLLRIWECEVEGMKVQLIQLIDTKARWKVVDNIDVSICKIAYLSNKTISMHQDFKLTLASKVMFLKDGHSWCTSKHTQKMKERFQDKGEFFFGGRQSAVARVVHLVLAGVE